jgi:hypothetical protein
MSPLQVPSRTASAGFAVADFGQGKETTEAAVAIARLVCGSWLFGAHVKAVYEMANCACSLSVPAGFSAKRAAARGTRHVATDMESGWAELPGELLMKVLEALQAAEQCAPQDGGWGGRRRCGWCVVGASGCRHDTLVMWVLLRHAGDVGVAEIGCHRRGGGRAGAARRWLAGPQVLLL